MYENRVFPELGRLLSSLVLSLNLSALGERVVRDAT